MCADGDDNDGNDIIMKLVMVVMYELYGDMVVLVILGMMMVM
jgi:hypothetical protein